LKSGPALPGPPLRIYLTGGVCAESPRGRLGEERFPSPQARRLFAALVLERHRALPTGQAVEILWRDRVPRAPEAALKALVSKIRGVLKEALPELRAGGSDLLASRYGGYGLQLPAGSWVDVEAARQALDEAEGLMRAGRAREAWGLTNVCLAVTGRELLPGEAGEWVEAKRRELAALRLRALESYVDICLECGQNALAAQVAREAIALDPFRETCHQRLMRCEAALGNRAEAVRAYHRCRELLKEELGVEPSPETQEQFLRLLRSPA
jgi:DNA-binding SARP family transcriptional activator